MASRDLAGLLGPVELNLSLRWDTSSEHDEVRGTLRLHELARYRGHRLQSESREEDLYASVGLSERVLRMASYGARGQVVGLVDNAIQRAAFRVVDLYVARRVCRSAAFGLFALDQGYGLEHAEAVQGLWLAERGRVRPIYEDRCADLTRWLERMPP